MLTHSSHDFSHGYPAYFIMNCFPTLAEIKHDHEQLKKSQSFEIQNICRTCGHFQKDTDFWDVIGVCSISGLSVAGAAVCSIDRWVEKKRII